MSGDEKFASIQAASAAPHTPGAISFAAQNTELCVLYPVTCQGLVVINAVIRAKHVENEQTFVT